MQKIKDPAFLLLVIAATVAFAWIILPFYGAILWATAIAILFYPLHWKLRAAMGNRASAAAMAGVVLIVALVILPLSLVAASLGQQASGIYGRMQSGDLDFALYLERILNALPDWLMEILNYFGLTDPAATIRKLTDALAQASRQIAARALGIGLNAFDFALSLGVMLYLLFFLLRDGDVLLEKFKATVPLRTKSKTILFDRISLVVRGTIQGGIVVAIIQGMLGGIAFWVLGITAPVLWAIVMALLSLLPAIGAAIVWVPVAIYLLATGSIWQAFFLIAFGILVIGLVDNFLRPFLVGKAAKLPDFIILITTLGGIAVFGMNGFIIGPLIASIFIVSWEIFRTAEWFDDRRSDSPL